MNPPAENISKQATLPPILFMQLATDAHALVTNSKIWLGCNAFDLLLHNLLTFIFWTVAMVPFVFVVKSVHTDVPTHILPSAIATISMPKDQ